eukprot:7380148-Prymnesium_polylepis.1
MRCGRPAAVSTQCLLHKQEPDPPMSAANAAARPPASPGGDAPHSTNLMAKAVACARGHSSVVASRTVSAATALVPALTAQPVRKTAAAAGPEHRPSPACPPDRRPCGCPRGWHWGGRPR